MSAQRHVEQSLFPEIKPDRPVGYLHDGINPAFHAPIARWQGRTWIDTDPAALAHPSAHGQQFRIGDDPACWTNRGIPSRIAGRSGRVCLWAVRTVEHPSPLLLDPHDRVWLEVNP